MDFQTGTPCLVRVAHAPCILDSSSHHSGAKETRLLSAIQVKRTLAKESACYPRIPGRSEMTPHASIRGNPRLPPRPLKSVVEPTRWRPRIEVLDIPLGGAGHTPPFKGLYGSIRCVG